MELDFSHAARRESTAFLVRASLNGARAQDLRAIIPLHIKSWGLATLRDLPLTGTVTGDVHASAPLKKLLEHIRGDGIVIGGSDAALWRKRVHGNRVRFHFHGPAFSLDTLELRGATTRGR
ncbi:MAG TPA: hypothetical protein VGO62_05530 [Myxococcota bacterium]